MFCRVGFFHGNPFGGKVKQNDDGIAEVQSDGEWERKIKCVCVSVSVRLCECTTVRFK